MKRTLPVAIAAITAAVPVQAQDGLTLDPVIISGGLTGIAEDNFTRSYSTVTSEDLTARGITKVQDALRALPGVSVASTGDSLTGVFIRGGESNHVKVLIDGVEMNDTTNGSYSFAGLSVANIDKIEVLRGPQSVLYGTSAMSGVISITTKRAERDGFSGSVGVELAKDGQYDADLALRQGFGSGQLSFTTEARRSNYTYARRGLAPVENESRTYNLNGDTYLSDTVRIGFNLRKFDQDYQSYSTASPVSGPEFYLTSTLSTTDRDELSGAVWLEADSLGGRLLHRFELSAMDQTNTYNSAFGVSTYGSTRQSLKYTASFALDGDDARTANHKLNFRAEAHRETFDITSAFSNGTEARNSHAVAVDYQGHFANGLDVQAGIRHDVIDVFENPTSWNLSAAYSIPDTPIRLRGSVGRATVYPTMYEQFGYSPGTFTGNPNLRPEHSLSYEAGVDVTFGSGFDAGATVFYNEVEDMIQSAGSFATNVAGTSTRKGVELSANWQANDWLSFTGSYTYTHARDSSGGRLIRRPEHEVGFEVRAKTFGGRGNVSADVRYVAGSYDSEFWQGFPAPTTELPAFTVVNIAAQYEVMDNLVLTGRVTNLFDTNYSEAWGYYGQGRTVYIGATSTF